MELTIHQIEKYLVEWFKNRENHFKYLFPLKGGWEACMDTGRLCFFINI